MCRPHQSATTWLHLHLPSVLLGCRASRRRRSGRYEQDSEEEEAAQEEAAQHQVEEDEEEEDEEEEEEVGKRRQRQRGGQPPQQVSVAQRQQQQPPKQRHQQQQQLGQPVGEDESYEEAGDSAVGPLRPSPALHTPPVRRLLPALSPHVAGGAFGCREPGRVSDVEACPCAACRFGFQPCTWLWRKVGLR